ncbi:hypothetical protein [Streptococcus porci]|nr:hypothetical protein [Streptococcus porci]
MVCYYAFAFDLGVDFVMQAPIHDLEVIAATKVAIENFKNSD